MQNLKKIKYKETPSPHTANLSILSQYLKGTRTPSCWAGKLQQGQNFVLLLNS